MNDLHYGRFACTNEIKPKFPPKVQAIWDDCGTNVTPMEVNILCQGVSMILQVVRDA